MARVQYDRSQSRVINITKGKRERLQQKADNITANKVTVETGLPKGSDGRIGDITIRMLPDGSYRAYAKLASGWYDINTMVPSNQTAWTDMALLGNWRTFGTGSTITVDVPSYYKDDQGIVYLRGGVEQTSGTITNTITTLPSGFRPRFNQFRLVLDGDLTDPATANTAVLKITSAGVVNVHESGNNTGTLLDGVWFFAHQEVKTIQTQHGGSSRGIVDTTIHHPPL